MLLDFWNIRPGRAEEWQRTKHWMLAERGWVGLVVCNTSAFEHAAILKCLGEYQSDDIHVCRVTLMEENSAEIGSFKSDSRVYVFKDEVGRERFKTMLANLPPRSQKILVRSDTDPKSVKKLLGNTNWLLIEGSEQYELTMEDCVEAVHVKMHFG